MLYCRDLPKTVKLKANNGRNVELVAWQHGVGVNAFWYMPATAGFPLFVILDTAAANAVMTTFVSFGVAPYDDLLTAGTLSTSESVSTGAVSAAMTGADRPVLGSFKMFAGPTLVQRLAASVWLMPADGIYEVSKGPTYAIKGSASDLAKQFLQCMVDAQK